MNGYARLLLLFSMVAFLSTAVMSNEKSEINGKEEMNIAAEIESGTGTPGEGRIIGTKGGFLYKTKIIEPDSGLEQRAIRASIMMKSISRTTKDNGQGPLTIEEAAAYLSRRVNMAWPPTKCFEYNGSFYFSGGLSAKPVEDFSSGYAIRRGERTVFSWTELTEEDNESKKEGCVDSATR